MLKGTNVVLRPVEREDLKRMQELWLNIDLIVLGHGEWTPRSLAGREKWFDKHLADEHQERSWFAIEADGKVIGDAGLHHSDRRSGSTQFGIGIYDPDYVSKGYGREALLLLLDWAFRIQNWRRIWLEALACNERAQRLYRSIGFVDEGRLREQHFYDGRYEDVVLMGMLRSEWETIHVSEAAVAMR